MPIKGGLTIVFNNLGKIGPAMQADLAGVVRETAEDVATGVKTRMSTPGHGRVYQRRGRSHQASAPGQPPAVDTGALRASVHAQMTGPLEATVGTNQPQARRLEMGDGHIAPRPAWRPEIESKRQAFIAAVTRVLARGRA